MSAKNKATTKEMGGANRFTLNCLDESRRIATEFAEFISRQARFLEKAAAFFRWSEAVSDLATGKLVLPVAAASPQPGALREVPIFWLALSGAASCASLSWQQRPRASY